jgi:hypothetical protein
MNADRIRELNDAFRRTFAGGKVMMTSGVDELPDCVKAEALRQVATFSDFTPTTILMASTTSAASRWWVVSSSGKSTTTTER